MQKRDLLKNYIFYGLLSIFVFFNIDLSTMLLIRISGMNIYYGDIFFFLILVIAVWAFFKNYKDWRWTQPVTTWYLLFLAWLALAVIWGWRIYGYRAFGESRYVLPFFAFFIPYFLLTYKRSDDPALVGKYVRMTTFIAAAAAILFLICSLIYRKPFYFSAINLKNQKFWVYKIIDSNQAFHIILLAMFIFFLSFFRKKFFSLPKIVFFLLLLITLPVYNRTAETSLFAALLVLLMLGKKFREILFACASVAVIFALLHFVPAIEHFYYSVQSRQRVPAPIHQQMPKANNRQMPDLSRQQVPAPIHRQMPKANNQQMPRANNRQMPDLSRQRVPDLNIEQVKGMQTGYWRFYQAKAALRLALKKPLFGQHLGGYFDFFILETNEKNIYPPHNQYILTLLKTGIIGLVLLLVPLLLLLWGLYKALVDERLETNEKSTAWLLLLVLLAQLPYGMGFGFISLYAIYFGFGAIFIDSLAKKYPLQLRIKKN